MLFLEVDFRTRRAITPIIFEGEDHINIACPNPYDM